MLDNDREDSTFIRKLLHILLFYTKKELDKLTLPENNNKKEYLPQKFRNINIATY